MKRRNVYIGMVLIFLTTSAVFAFLFLNQARALPTGLNTIINPTGAPTFNQHIYGDFNISLEKPMDVAKTDSFIYISDTNNKRVTVFDIAGQPLFTFGKEGKGPGEFMFPYGISTAADGRVYVADMYNGKISIHDDKGEFIEYFAPELSEAGTIKSPAGLRIINDKVYVTDIQRNKALIIDMNGQLLLEIGEGGSENGQFLAPNAITADNEGNIYVVDTGNHRLQIFDPEGNFTRMINGSEGNAGTSVVVNPRGVGIDSRGFVYVVSNLTHMIHGFDKEGKEMFQFGGMGEGNTQFYLPNGLYIDSEDNVYISDTLNLRIAHYN